MTKQDCKDIPCGAIPPCTGTHVKEIMRTQAELAEADDFVFYECEWMYNGETHCGTAQLGPEGTYRLGMVLRRLPDVPFPVLIQTNLDEKLNEARRNFIVQYLRDNGIPDADQRVIVGFPTAEGLFGTEACPAFYRGFYGQQYGGGLYGGAGAYGGGAIGAYGVSSFGLSGYGGLGGLGGIGAMGGLGGFGAMRR
jgi:hypothetical protein